MSHRPPYTRGLHELGDGLHAFLQPDGGWGWSNAGLIVADGASLLIDTLFDLTLTAEMLAAMRPLLARSPLSGAFNTRDVGPGGAATFTAPATAGTYPYICMIHQFMHATLVVS